MPPTTTVTISRQTAPSADGDPVNENAPLYFGVPAIIAYQSDVSRDPASGEPVQIDAVQAYFDNGTDIQNQDLITDMQTGEQYEVTSVRKLPSYGIPTDLTVAMRRMVGFQADTSA